ncbi:hypothetical protein [Pseudobdellovibrio exovorus]|uniref:Ppx/GppA phosphatase N-terminal domain-containing protein n=1 Tax=Pseudobdellovibrio exovorus JSS TaxID=1184267 RepID=M4V761_9BACT|nr:hypothetical protein [Pseudobdellovibrio exovorus]AGH95028.1 hypothetical protein A11Q_810 [Pseudobdellovibrio exovorus JSS]
MRLSSIDIGSNAIRQVIVEVKEDGSWKILKKHREMIRLGADVFKDGLIHSDTQNRLIPAFKRMARNNRKFKVEKNLAIATSAFRDAKNKKPVLAAIFRHSKIKIQVISGHKEAQLIRLAVQRAIGSNNEHNLLIDIGGGSVELTHLQGSKIFYSRSFKWGGVRTLAEAQKHNTTPQNILRKKLKQNSKLLPKGPFAVAIGTGGNLDAIAKLKLSFLKKGPNTMVSYDELKSIYDAFRKTRVSQRSEKFNLRPDRVDVIEPAIYLTLTLMKKYQIKRIKIPGTGLKDGAILSLL